MSKIDWSIFPLFDKLYHKTYKITLEKAQDMGLSISDYKLFDKNVNFETKFTYGIITTGLFLVLLIIIKNIFFR